MCPRPVPRRASQTYVLVCPNLKQRIRPAQISTLTPKLSSGRFIATDFVLQCFFEEPKDWVWSLLARPVPMSTSITLTPSNGAAISVVESVPTELLYMILDLLAEEDKKDVVALSRCSKTLYNTVVQHAHSSYLQCAAPWAGKPLAFIGSHTADLPTSFQDDTFPDLQPRLVLSGYIRRSEFEDKINKWESPGIMHELEHAYRSGQGAEQEPREDGHIAEWSDKSYNVCMRRPRGPEGRFLSASLPRSIDMRPPPLPSKVQCNTESHLCMFKHFPQDRTWVLRNRTTKQYVTSAALDKHNTRYAELHPYLKFHHILLPRISWSSATSGMDRDYQNIRYGRENKHCRGDWAGHTFDIVVWEEHMRELNKAEVAPEKHSGGKMKSALEAEYWGDGGPGGEEKQWKDVSDEAIAFAVELWDIATASSAELRKKYGCVKRAVRPKVSSGVTSRKMRVQGKFSDSRQF